MMNSLSSAKPIRAKGQMKKGIYGLLVLLAMVAAAFISSSVRMGVSSTTFYRNTLSGLRFVAGSLRTAAAGFLDGLSL